MKLKNQFFLVVISSIMIVSLQGCVAHSPRHPTETTTKTFPDPGAKKASVYFINGGSALGLNVSAFVNNQKIGSFDQGDYFHFSVKPGKYLFHVAQTTVWGTYAQRGKETFMLKPNKTHFIVWKSGSDELNRVLNWKGESLVRKGSRLVATNTNKTEPPLEPYTAPDTEKSSPSEKVHPEEVPQRDHEQYGKWMRQHARRMSAHFQEITREAERGQLSKVKNTTQQMDRLIAIGLRKNAGPTMQKVKDDYDQALREYRKGNVLIRRAIKQGRDQQVLEKAWQHWEKARRYLDRAKNHLQQIMQ